MTIDTKLIDAIIAKTANKQAQEKYVSCLMKFEDLYKLLNSDEKEFVEELLRQKPSEFGLTEPYLGIEGVPDDIMSVKDQAIHYDGKTVVLDTKYVPRKVYEAYSQLNRAYKASSGKSILIGSGYRSAAYQAVNFIKWLQYYKYDFKKTLGYVSIPGYSQHSLAHHTALDFITEEGIGVFDEPPFGRFDETQEYQWLLKNADKYKFILPFPKDNQWNSEFEPWHWQFVG